MTRRRYAAAAVLTVVVALTGCGPEGPSDEELQVASDDARATVIAVADDVMAALRSSNPNLTFIDEPDPLGPARYWDCSDNPAPTGEAIQWAAHRGVQIEPIQPTDDLLDPVVDQLLHDGWVLTRDETEDSARLVRVDRDGYMIEIAGDPQLDAGDPTHVSLAAYSPCLEAPEEVPEG